MRRSSRSRNEVEEYTSHGTRVYIVGVVGGERSGIKSSDEMGVQVLRLRICKKNRRKVHTIKINKYLMDQEIVDSIFGFYKLRPES